MKEDETGSKQNLSIIAIKLVFLVVAISVMLPNYLFFDTNTMHKASELDNAFLFATFTLILSVAIWEIGKNFGKRQINQGYLSEIKSKIILFYNSAGMLVKIILFLLIAILLYHLALWLSGSDSGVEIRNTPLDIGIFSLILDLFSILFSAAEFFALVIIRYLVMPAVAIGMIASFLNIELIKIPPYLQFWFDLWKLLKP